MANRNTPFQLNGYSFIDGKFFFGGIELPGVRALSIKTTQEKNNKYGAGVNPIARGRGVKETEGSIDLDLETRNIIMSKLGVAAVDMTDIPPLPLVVIFDNGEEVVTATVPFTEFKNDGVETSQGDDELVMTYDLAVGIPIIS